MRKVAGAKHKMVATKGPWRTTTSPPPISILTAPPRTPANDVAAATPEAFDEMSASIDLHDAIAEFVHMLDDNTVDIDQAPIDRGSLTKLNDDDEDDDGPRNKNKRDGNKKAKDKIKREVEASSLRDKIDHMVKYNESLVINTMEAKEELAEKKAQEKQVKRQLLKDETMRKAPIEERRAMAEEN
ncbi:putative galacturonosyltransferase 14 [Hordeum vulgare]|nr:putative galacturonosyltransferase 14 [Hordeum vulgare]